MTAPNEPMTLETLLAQGLSAFYAWIDAQAQKAESTVFLVGHLAANPLACYINAHLGDQEHQAHFYEGVIYTASGAQVGPEDFQRFLWDVHTTFAGAVSAPVLAAGIAQGRPSRYQPDRPDTHEAICQALGQVISLVRQGFLDPNQPTDEECLGMALATYCSWEGPRIARTCLRLCYAAFEEANYATMERLLIACFGEEPFR